MSQVSVEESARMLMRDMFGVPEEVLMPTAHIVDDLDLDSIDLVDWITRLNELHELDLAPTDFADCVHLEDFLKILTSRAS